MAPPRRVISAGRGCIIYNSIVVLYTGRSENIIVFMDIT